MARVKKTMQLVEKSIGRINDNYDMRAENIEDIRKASRDFYDLICNGFRFGYMQGMKAARAEMKKGGALNGKMTLRHFMTGHSRMDIPMTYQLTV